MKPLFFGFAINRPEHKVKVCAISESYMDAVDETEQIAGNDVQRVFDLVHDIAGLHNWMIDNGIPRHECKALLVQLMIELKTRTIIAKG